MKRLIRYPIRKLELLQAWDAADELILKHLESVDLTHKSILVLNDAFGALAASLLESNPSLKLTSYVDSYNSFRASQINTNEKVSPLSQLSEIQGVFDIVLVKIPKNMSFFEDELASLTRHFRKNSTVLICGAMVKHLPKTAFDLLNQYVGVTSTSLAQKKARLVFATFEKDPIESSYPKEVSIEGFDKTFTHHSNLFSREGLDIGTRFFLEHIPKGDFKTIIDLGCANGIVGIQAKKLNPNAKIVFTDVSQMAILSAKANYSKYFNDTAQFYWANCLENVPVSEVDLVLCNPPFHQEMAVSDATARSMFEAAFDALRDDGQLRVIGNSHLRYDAILKKVFGNAHVVATNKKFMIVDSVKDWGHGRIY